MIRELEEKDIYGLLELYTHLHEKSVPENAQRTKLIADYILSNENYHIIVAEEDGKIVSSCTCLIVPNFTHNLRPYALVENVVTHADYRKKGLASACLEMAKQIAESENCYKLMLMTGSKEESTLNFYRKAGYSSESKTGFVQPLE